MKNVIAPPCGWVSLDLSELWTYRELLCFLVWRDLKVRYRQTILGAMWAILQPVLTMVVFSFLFGRLAKIPSDGIPYPVFAYTGLLPWQLFAHALTESGNSIVAHQQLITKVYFPRLVIPIAAVLSGLVDTAIASVVLVLLMLHYGIVPTVAALALPFWMLLAIGAALGVGLWLAALNVQYRDVRYTLPFLTQVWLFLTPIAYPASLVPEPWRPFYGLNPMAGVVEGFRWSLLGTGQAPTTLLAVSVGVVLVVLIGGLWYFKRLERSFADVV